MKMVIIVSKYKINQGDSLEILSKMPNECINTAVTSPPYWGLRDYGVEGQLGLEETPDEYVSNLCGIFDELKRALRDDGTFWLNLGDTYAGGGAVAGKPDDWEDEHNDENYPDSTPARDSQSFGLKDKDLIGIPWRVALEMQSRGWYLRNDIIWHKPSTMPESVTDRCTTSHEHIFLFAKNKDYYYDQDAVRENFQSDGNFHSIGKQKEVRGDGNAGGAINNKKGKNKRDVWSVNPASFSDAHFAVYPEELIKPCIKAGCPNDGIVLDPFFGAGTTGVVAKRLDRKFVGIELNDDYIEIAEERLQDYEWGEGFPQERELPYKAKFLTSVDGIGEKTALTIWDHFDQNIHDIVTSDLTQVDGVGEKTFEQFKKEISNEI